MAKQQIPFPVIELLTGDEIQEALLRLVLSRKGLGAAEIDAFLRRAYQAQVSYRNVKFPDGSVSLFASVGIFSPREQARAVATDTPIPQEQKDG